MLCFFKNYLYSFPLSYITKVVKKNSVFKLQVQIRRWFNEDFSLWQRLPEQSLTRRMERSRNVAKIQKHLKHNKHIEDDMKEKPGPCDGQTAGRKGKNQKHRKYLVCLKMWSERLVIWHSGGANLQQKVARGKHTPTQKNEMTEPGSESWQPPRVIKGRGV